MRTLRYRELGRYTHRVHESYSVYCEELKGITINRSPFWSIIDGVITANKGYCWDSASGPTIDHGNPKSKIGSLIHDILYQAIEQGYLSQDYYPAADRMLYTLLIHSGMWKIRAKMWYYAVRAFGSFTRNPARKEYVTKEARLFPDET